MVALEKATVAGVAPTRSPPLISARLGRYSQNDPPTCRGTQRTCDTKQGTQTRGHMIHKRTERLPVGMHVLLRDRHHAPLFPARAFHFEELLMRLGGPWGHSRMEARPLCGRGTVMHHQYQSTHMRWTGCNAPIRLPCPNSKHKQDPHHPTF